MLTALGTRLVEALDDKELGHAFALAFVPEHWRREHCIDTDQHEVVFMHSGDWYCYHCGSYDEPSD